MYFKELKDSNKLFFKAREDFELFFFQLDLIRLIEFSILRKKKLNVSSRRIRL